jgi:hypothetical protein
MKRPTILNSQGKPIVLNNREAMISNNLEKAANALGFQIDITSLTTIMKKVTEQKFFEIAPADYLPVRVGEGAWSTQLTTYRSFNLADDFATGVIATGGNNARLASGDAGVDAINVSVINWAKQIGWSLFDLQQASKSGNWDLVVAKEKSRKKNWDLGIQKVAFLGLSGNSAVKGLLNQSATVNTSLINEAISGMTEAELSTFLQGILAAYRTNCSRTAMPSHFVIPESDYLGLATPTSATYPLKSKLQLMLETFQIMTGNKDFKILPCAYADAANSDGALTYNRYALYSYEEESLRMDIPVDYTNTLANSIDNFSFQNVGYGQFTGALAYRPAEMLYFDID